jgi:enolase
VSAIDPATGLGDEGGFAPQIARPEDVLAEIVGAITDAGYEPGRNGVAVALDPAASEFYRDGRYRVAGEVLSMLDMIAFYADLVDRFPVWSIEDGQADEDWVQLTKELGSRVHLVGDDIFVTNPAIIAHAIKKKVGNAA